MRKAMICVCVMLAMVQVWPMLFGHRAGEASAASSERAAQPKLIPAVATAKIVPAKVSMPAGGAPKSCYKQYQAAFAVCAKDDQACHIKTADQWDLCEATGFWPS
ncbi:hypothetical protein GCM10009087_54380 [Sphingomonas oligophenolica]|uniref:DUF3551 domain-containing protein n=1 Tax=Sphingomonas oligophenolica TaxID=301154 RepID=A0ABU9YCM6_9SPHN